MAPPGLDPVEESRRLLPFRVWQHVLASRAVADHWAAVPLVDMYGCMYVCVCVYFPACIGWLPLFSSWVIWHISTLSENLIRCTNLGGLFTSCDSALLSPLANWSSDCQAVPRNGALKISLSLPQAHTPFWSGSRRHYWLSSKLASVPQVLKPAILWRGYLWAVLPVIRDP